MAQMERRLDAPNDTGDRENSKTPSEPSGPTAASVSDARRKMSRGVTVPATHFLGVYRLLSAGFAGARKPLSRR